MRKFIGLMVLLAACKHELTPEEQSNIDSWVEAYLEADLRVRETAVQASGEHLRAIRERDAVEMKLVSAAEDSVQAKGIRRSITVKATAQSKREQDLKQEKAQIMVQGRELSEGDKKRLAELDAELRRLGMRQETLSQLAARLLPKSEEPADNRPSAPPPGGYR
jgi:hypothetical protein